VAVAVAVAEVQLQAEVVEEVGEDSFHDMIGEEEKVVNNLHRIQDNHPAHYPI
jgi:hypothetical protein